MMPGNAAESRARVARAIDRIHGALRSFVDPAAPHGLLDGACGAALFYAYDFQRTQDDAALDLAHRAVTQALAALAGTQMSHALCSGTAGIAWCLQHLVRMELLSAEDTDATFAEVDAVLARAMDTALQGGGYDFLHQGLGIALYFLERLPAASARAALETAVHHLAAHAAPAPGGGLRWRDRFTGRARELSSGPCYNLGLAHGIPAIVGVLAAIHARGIATEHTAPLLRGATSWLRSLACPDGASCYPILVDADDRPLGPPHSRLGWCYGDLGVAMPLVAAGRALDDASCIADARAILVHALDRTAADGAIEDASLCHGSMGVSHMLRRAARATGDAALDRGADRWLAHTLDIGEGPDGPDAPAGFACWMQDGFVARHDVLQGIAGVGLGLLAALDFESSSGWDRCLLLS
jgi:hypothetical protein